VGTSYTLGIAGGVLLLACGGSQEVPPADAGPDATTLDGQVSDASSADAPVGDADGRDADGSTNCAGPGQPAGGKIAVKCCAGLWGMPATWLLADGGCANPPPSSQLCGRCGDGICNDAEDTCSCPADCK
jgi:hypothetical protein